MIEATAISGHPLLRDAAIEAAMESKFPPAMLPDKLKTGGIIIYNFVPGINFTQIGFALGAITSNFDENLPAGRIHSALPADWTDSRDIAGLLVNKQNWDRRQKIALRTNTTNQNSAALNNSDDEPVEVKESYNALIYSLSESIKNHLSVDVSKKWDFMLGLTIGKTFAEISNETNLRSNLAELKQLAATAPSTVQVDFVNELQRTAALADDGELTAADKAKIEIFAPRLR